MDSGDARPSLAPMSNGLPLDTTEVISVSLEAMLYGFSVLMFVGTIYALLHNRSKHDIHYGMLSVACLLLVFSTTHLIVNIVRLIDGFVKFRDTFPGGPLGYFGDISDSSYVLKNAILAAQTLTGDGVMIYRCYVVWRSFWVAIPLVLGWCAVLVTGILAPYTVSQATSHSGDIFFKKTARWVTAFYASTFATNLLGTCFLAFGLWSIRRKAEIRLTRQGLNHAMRIVVDAGLLYSANMLATIVCFVRGANGQYITETMMCPIISIAFYMIIIRVVIPKTFRPNEGVIMTTLRSNHDHYDTNWRRGPMQVHISNLVETDGAHKGISESCDQV